MSDKLSIEENIKNTYLNPMSFLYEEPMNLLKQEVREPAIYNAIVFEEICKQYLWKQLLMGKTSIEFISLGRWWGNDPRQKK